MRLDGAALPSYSEDEIAHAQPGNITDPNLEIGPGVAIVIGAGQNATPLLHMSDRIRRSRRAAKIEILIAFMAAVYIQRR